MENIYKKDDKIMIEVPFELKRENPYMEGEDVGKYQTLIGIICGEEMGFALTIDMNYAGKDDQWTDIKYRWWGDREDFIKKCDELGISYFKYSICACCEKPIFGSFTLGEKGEMCFDCESKAKEVKAKGARLLSKNLI